MSMQEYIELNLSNYNHEDVEQLNAWAIWAAEEIEEILEEKNLLLSTILALGRRAGKSEDEVMAMLRHSQEERTNG